MLQKKSIILSLALIILVQAACMTESTPVIAPTLAETSPTPASPVDACPAPTGDLQVLVSDENGYCLLYPAAYSTDFQNYVVINPITGAGDVPGDAWVSITVEPAAGRTAAQVADEKIAEVGPGFNITRSDIQIDGEPAVVVDGIPGQDSSRSVFVSKNEMLYMLIFAPWYPNTVDPSQPTQLEQLYSTVIETLHFFPPK